MSTALAICHNISMAIYFVSLLNIMLFQVGSRSMLYFCQFSGHLLRPFVIFAVIGFVIQLSVYEVSDIAYRDFALGGERVYNMDSKALLNSTVALCILLIIQMFWRQT